MRNDVRFELINDKISMIDDSDFFFVQLGYNTAVNEGDKSRVAVACSILEEYDLSFDDFDFWMTYDPTKGITPPQLDNYKKFCYN